MDFETDIYSKLMNSLKIPSKEKTTSMERVHDQCVDQLKIKTREIFQEVFINAHDVDYLQLDEKDLNKLLGAIDVIVVKKWTLKVSISEGVLQDFEINNSSQGFVSQETSRGFDYYQKNTFAISLQRERQIRDYTTLAFDKVENYIKVDLPYFAQQELKNSSKMGLRKGGR